MATSREISSSSDQITQLCKLCDKNVYDGYCVECEEYMCQSCFDIHTRVRTCRNHILIDDINNPNINKKTFSEPCKQHPNQIIEFYCIDHKYAGCVKCLFPKHRICNSESIEDAAQRFKTSGEDKRLTGELQKLENIHSEYMRQIEIDTETAVALNEKTIQDMNSFVDRVFSYAENVKRYVLEKSERLHRENETHLEERQEQLNSVGDEIETLKVNLENEDNLGKKFIKSTEISPEVEELGQKITSYGQQSVIKKYEFHPNKQVFKMMKGSDYYGEILIMPASCATAQSPESVSTITSKPSESVPTSSTQSCEIDYISPGQSSPPTSKYVPPWTEMKKETESFHKTCITQAVPKTKGPLSGHVSPRDVNRNACQPPPVINELSTKPTTLPHRHLSSSASHVHPVRHVVSHGKKTFIEYKDTNVCSTALEVIPEAKFSVAMNTFSDEGGIKVKVYKADILSLDVDCIVNAADGDLQHWGGVARSISKHAGPTLDAECKEYIRKHGELNVSQCCTTTAGNLKYRCVIHTVGPAWHDYGYHKTNRQHRSRKDCGDDLKLAVLNSLREAERKGMKTIALPAISSGILGVPIDICVKQYVRAVQQHSTNKGIFGI